MSQRRRKSTTTERPGLRMPSYYERQRLRHEKKLEIVQFAPVVRNELKPQTKVTMLTSVHGRFTNGYHYDLVAGKSYWVDQEKADEFIVKNYASGALSRKYSEDEMASIRSTIQVIDLDQGGITNG